MIQQRRSALPLAAALLLLRAPALEAQRPAPSAPIYVPERGEWRTVTPEDAGFDAARLDAAIRFAVANENPATKDLAVDLATTFGREPFDTPIGPVQPRGALNGLVIRHGRIAAEWGETSRADMMFSVTKSFLSTVSASRSRRG
jgi:hypothetical protein